jgi:hypothetical protein
MLRFSLPHGSHGRAERRPFKHAALVAYRRSLPAWMQAIPMFPTVTPIGYCLDRLRLKKADRREQGLRVVHEHELTPPVQPARTRATNNSASNIILCVSMYYYNLTQY